MSIPVVSSNTLLTSDNHRIHLDHYRLNHPQVVVIAHGFFNSKQAVLLKEFAQELLLAYDVILLDFRGHGKSSGLFSWTSREELDLLAVLEYAKQSYRSIGLVGFSLGAAISIGVAAQADLVNSLVAVSAPTEFGKIEYRFWELDAENDIFYNILGAGKVGKGVRPGPFWLTKPKPIALVEKINAPVLFIHGEKDWLIKPWHSESLYQRTRSKKHLSIIKDGPHAEYLVRKNKEEFVSLVWDWFKETL